jgi:zona occludens toxin (predicted ATPase)
VSIYLRTGQPGHGKSYGAVRVIKSALESGQWVATNIELKPGWALTMARMNVFRRMVPGRVAKTAADFESRLYVSHDLGEFSRLRLPPCGRCDSCRAGHRCRKEGRGRLVLDEAHNWLNARTWDADESGMSLTKNEAVQKRLSIVRLFSQHRKLGWHVDLITQDEANLDRQVRSLFEYHVHLKNLRRYKVFGLFPVVPCNVFVAVTTWHDNAKTRLGAETFLLNKKLAACYDTTATSHGLDFDADDAIWLGGDAVRAAGRPPRRQPGRPAAPAGPPPARAAPPPATASPGAARP